jgi:hypothetical protein
MTLDQFTKGELIARTNPQHQIDVIGSPRGDRLAAKCVVSGRWDL